MRGERTDRPLPDPETPLPTGKTIREAIERIAPGRRDLDDELVLADVRLLDRILNDRSMYNAGRFGGETVDRAGVGDQVVTSSAPAMGDLVRPPERPEEVGDERTGRS